MHTGIAVTVGIAVLSLVATVAIPSPAVAEATGCAGVDAQGGYYEQLCNYTTGYGRYVDHVQVRRESFEFPAIPRNICGYQAYLEGTLDNGAPYGRESSFHEGCSSGMAWFDFRSPVFLQDGSRLCALWHESGRTYDQKACNGIEKRPGDERELDCPSTTRSYDLDSCLPPLD